MKRYIVQRESVPTLAEAIVLQDSKIYLEKDSKSSLYVAHIDSDVQIPSSVKALEFTEKEETSVVPADSESKDQRRFLDLRLCIEIPGEINKEKLEKVLYTEISKTLKGLIKNDEKEGDDKEQE